MEYSAFDSTSDLLLCRLCLREYDEDSMHGIFSEYSTLEDRIFSAVSVKPHLEDSSITICSNCNDLIAMINDFRAACKHSSSLLENQTKILQSSTWKPSIVEETFSKAANLVQQHRKEVEYLLKINDPAAITDDFPDYHEVPEDPVPTPPSNPVPPKNNYFQNLTLYGRPNPKIVCDVCGKTINGMASWRVHQKLHTEEPKFVCDVCGKKFRKKWALNQHSTVHTGIAKFQCEICDKCFTIKHNLKTHLKIHARKQDDQKIIKANKDISEVKDE